MSKITEKSLIDALAYCSLPRLPEVDNGEDFWIKAIAKVVKSNGGEYYVLVEKDVNTLENRIVRDFGDLLTIAKVVEYYPFDFLKARYMPTFKGNSKEPRISYLVNYSGKTREELEGMTVKQLEKELLKVAIKLQIENEK